jgi:crotonobetainyl-CoA:carnitine CoA-transferase CaiB-like acyl-CoA transferase
VNERRSGSAKRFWRSGQPVGRAGKLPLHGCLVLDLSAMIAGPISTRTLAELGADVIKIDAPKPAHGPRMICYYGLEASHGKRSALLDLTTPAGLAVLKRLAAQADVVVHNFTPPAMKKLGLDALMSDPDYQHLTWAGVSAFRGPKPGPWDARRGYDQVMQAATGIQVRYSDKTAPDLHGIASCVDYITGYLLTYAVMTALYCGQREAGVSLAQAAQFIQAPFMLAHPNHKADEPQGRMAKGSNWHNRLYQCRDGWIYVEASDRQAKHLPGAVGVSFIYDPQWLTGQLESAIRNLKKADALAMLKRATVPAISVTSLGDLKSGVNPAPHSIRVEKASHPAAREVTRVPPSWLFGKGNKLKDWGPFSKPGCNTVEVLSRAGLNEAERSQLIKSGAAATDLAEAYLPE